VNRDWSEFHPAESILSGDTILCEWGIVNFKAVRAADGSGGQAAAGAAMDANAYLA